MICGRAPWKQDLQLRGDLQACPAVPRPFPVGANGIFVDHDAVWTLNTDKGALVKVAIESDGSPGAVTTVAQDCSTLEGVDGLRSDPARPDAAFLATNNTSHSIVRITRTGQVAIVSAGKPPFYSPADLVHVPATRNPSIFLVANASFDEALAPADSGLTPKPSLLVLSVP